MYAVSSIFGFEVFLGQFLEELVIVPEEPPNPVPPLLGKAIEMLGFMRRRGKDKTSKPFPESPPGFLDIQIIEKQDNRLCRRGPAIEPTGTKWHTHLAVPIPYPDSPFISAPMRPMNCPIGEPSLFAQMIEFGHDITYSPTGPSLRENVSNNVLICKKKVKPTNGAKPE